MLGSIPVYGIITIIMLISRILLESSSQEILAMAVINLIALLMVLSSITLHTKQLIEDKLIQSGVPIEIINRERRNTNIRINLFLYIPLILIYILYLFFFYSGLGNDLISIIALGLSLSDKFIADAIVSQYGE